MVVSSKTFLKYPTLFRGVVGALRFGSKWLGRVAPAVAAQAAVWLFTKPHRSLILPHEEQLLAKAHAYNLDHEGGKLAVMEWGAGPTVLCSHGWSSRGLRFSHLIEALAESGFHVVTFDAPAHGRSSGSHTDLMDHVNALLRVSQDIGPIHGIVAHSFGATAALVALEKGLTVEKAVFFSALNGLRGPLSYLARQLRISDKVFQKVKGLFEIKFNRSIESLEAVQIVPKLKTPPLLILHDPTDTLALRPRDPRARGRTRASSRCGRPGRRAR